MRTHTFMMAAEDGTVEGENVGVKKRTHRVEGLLVTGVDYG